MSRAPRPCFWPGPAGPATPARSEDTGPVRASTRPSSQCRAPGRSPRVRSASTHHRGNRHEADARSAPGSTRAPNRDRLDAACSGQSTPALPGQRSHHRSRVRHPTGDPTRTRVDEGFRRACTAWVAGQPDRPSIARPTPGTRACHPELPRFVAARETPSTETGESRERLISPHRPWLAAGQSPRARQTTNSGPF